MGFWDWVKGFVTYDGCQHSTPHSKHAVDVNSSRLCCLFPLRAADSMVTRTIVCFLRYGVDVDRWRESKMYIKCDEEGCRCGLNPTTIWRRCMRRKHEDGRGFHHTFSSKQSLMFSAPTEISHWLPGSARKETNSIACDHLCISDRAAQIYPAWCLTGLGINSAA